MTILALALVTTALSGGSLEPTSVWGNIYVFTQLGEWNNADCFEGHTTELTLDLLLNGASDSLICIDGSYSSQAIAETRVDLQSAGFSMQLNGWGEAVGGDDVAAFSRHDIDATMEVDLKADTRLRVDWFMLAAGLATVQLKLTRVGDIGGPDDWSSPIISRTISSYIDPIMLDGMDVLFMPQGRWRIRLYSTHQAMATSPDFMHAFARTNHEATFIPLGDVDGNTVVDVADLLLLLAQFGPCAGCQADLDGNGEVDVTDLLQLLADFGQSA
jgi:hypothetical protein